MPLHCCTLNLIKLEVPAISRMTMLFNFLPTFFADRKTQAAIVTVPILRDSLRAELLQLVGSDTFTPDIR